VGIRCSSPSVCLFVWPEHNSKTNDPKMFKPGIGNDLRIEMTWFSGFKVIDIGTCESEIFVRIELRIESGCSRLHVHCSMTNGDVRYLLVPQTILHHRSLYSANKCVCSFYINKQIINIKQISITTAQRLKFFC